MTNENKYEILLLDPEEPYFAPKYVFPPNCRRRLTDLPEDVVGEIMVRLSSADRIRLAVCCKMLWSLTPNYYNSNEIDQFPWLMKLHCYMNQSSFCCIFELFDPINQKPYSETCVREVTGKEGLSRDGMRLLCSRNSWLLCAWRNKIIILRPRGGYRQLTSLVLVSPLTKQIMALPDLDHSSLIKDDDDYAWTTMQVASYSCDPSSPDCVYFVLWKSKGDWPYDFKVSTFRNGDSEWKTAQFYSFIFPIQGLVYHEGSFYCVSDRGHIAAYSVVQNEWRSLIGPNPAKQNCDYSRYSYLLVCEGKLVVLFLDLPSNENYDEVEQCIIFEYDGQEKGDWVSDWVEKTSLGENALYLSPKGSFSVSASSDMANRIYYHRPGAGGGNKKYYSLEDGKAYACESSCWPGVDRWGMWLEPPQLHSQFDKIPSRIR